mmetsp:Transcript_11936/g.36769  ORF Transcript_11936/g.36769 Transcript_11936/m.36769 type:complete len:80 (+) Transcript_11936:105-344(+)
MERKLSSKASLETQSTPTDSSTSSTRSLFHLPSDLTETPKYWACKACRMPRNPIADSACVKCHAERGSTEKLRGVACKD